ncbi:MAG TPA: autotransporter-associated beta strand repeat-containing protein, partial [Burkholderiaceae bacterium]
GGGGGTGAGGAGVSLGTGATLTNYGTINGAGSAITPGTGVLVNGGTVINSGTINGGTDPLVPGYHVDAITFAGSGNRLELRQGSDIQGDVDANGGTDDTLALGGTVNGIFAVSSIGASQQYQGFESFEKTGSSAWTLTGTTDAVTSWTITQGTLSVSSDANLGATTGGLSFNGGTLENSSAFATARAIALEAGGGTLQTDADLTVSGVIAGTGGLAKTGDGILTLTGANSYTGGTNISAGTLMVDGTVVGAMNVASGGTLGGNGTVGGVTTVASGGTLIGRQGEVLTFGSDLTLSSGSNINVSLGAPESTGLFNVAGNLTLAGQLNVTDLGGLSVGVYRLFDYGGSLTDNGLAIGTLPAGVDTSDVTVQTAVANQVNLINTTGVTLRFWDGGNPANQDNNEVNGGDGVWTTSNANWTDANGAVNGAWTNDHFAIFEGSAGTVTVSGAISIAGMQFATDGYQIEGDAITLARSETIIRTGVGSYSGASVTATIASELTGTGGLVKTDFGTLVLTAANSYAGGTIVREGTLQLGDGGTSGSIIGDVANHGTLAFNRSDAYTFGGVISGTGTVIQAGTGTTELTGANSYTGGTTINAGTLSVSADDNLGAAAGSLAFDGGALENTATFTTARTITLATGGGTFNTAADLTASGVIFGTGALTKTGAGTLTLTGANTYAGGTTISAGTLQIGDGGTSGSIVGDVTNNSVLAFNRSDDLSYAGVISGSGALQQNGTGTTILTADNTYAGVTTITAGMLQLGNGGTSGSIVGDVVNNGVLAFDRSNDLSYAGAISGTGSLSKLGAGTLTLTAANTYSGGTIIDAGTLSISSDTNLGNASGGLIFNGGTLENTSAFTTTRAITLAADGTFNTAADLTATGAISGPGALTKTGAGTLTLTGDNAYAGGTTISAGTLQLGDGGTSGSIIGDVLNNGVLAFDRSDDLTYGGTVSGTGALIKTGTGTLTLTADSDNFTGPTTISQGTLQLGNGGPAGSIGGPITNNGALVFNRDATNTLTVQGVISGSGTVTQAGPGTTVLTGANIYTGGTSISAGTLSVAADGNLGAATGGLIFDGGTLENTSTFTTARAIALETGGGTLQTGADLTVSGTVSGAGALTKTGTGTLTLTGANIYTGGTSIGAGMLQLGNGGTSGWILGDVLNNGVLVFNRSDEVTFAGAISGSGALQQNGTGTTILTGASTYSGDTTIGAGTLNIAGSIGAGAVSVANGATLTGSGSIGGAVTVQDGGTLAGASGATLSMGALALNATSNVDVVLGTPSGTLFDVGGNLTLDGTLNLSGATGFGTGVYHLIEYGGSLIDNGLALGSQPLDFMTAINTATAQQVNLTVYADPTKTQFWQGGSAPVGGSGAWNATATNWLNADGSMSTLWGGVQGIFHGTPGTVMVDGAQAFQSLEFVVDGYTLVAGSGGALAPTGMAQLWAEGARTTATLATPITGAGGIVKIGAGTIVLAAANSYSGGTTIHAGTLSVSADNNLGAAAGGLAFDGGTLENTSAFTTGRAIALNSGGGTLRTTADLTASGVISGVGALTKTGAGTLTLTGTNIYTGGTTINAGTLQIGDGGTSGSILGNVVNNGVLALNLSNTLTLDGAISGSGALQQNGTGTTILTGASTYGGATSINAGALVVNGSIATSSLLTVNADGLVGGTGTLPATAINGGTLAPGNSIGTLSVQGNLALSTAATQKIEVSATAADRINVSGAATLGGAVQVAATPDDYGPHTSYVILHANGGVSGAETLSTTVSSVFLDPTLSFDANNVFLDLTQLPFSSVAWTPNQRAVADALQASGTHSALGAAVFNQATGAGARQAFDALSGEVHASAAGVMLDESRYLRDAVLGRARQAYGNVPYPLAALGPEVPTVTFASTAPQSSAALGYRAAGAQPVVPTRAADEPVSAAWAQAIGAWGRLDGDGNAATLDSSVGGFISGFDLTFA